MCNFIKNLFKKPTFKILPIKVMGSDTIYIPSVQMDGNWLPYLSQPYEGQQVGNWDELNCVSQSGINCIEAILNYYFVNHLLPQPLLDFIKNNGYLNSNGFIKLSTRFNAKMAGTTKQGLSMDAFWQSVNRDGILPYTAYPDPQGTFDWNTYYQPVPPEVIKAGQLAAKIFQFDWQVFQNNAWNPVDPTIYQNILKGSPIQFASYACSAINGVEPVCSSVGLDNVYSHARMVYAVDNCIEILDSELPALKKAAIQFPLASAIKMQLKIV